MEDVELFFRHFNRKRNGRLDLGEFATAIDPVDRYFASMLARRPSSGRKLNVYRKDDMFRPETAECFKELLRTHLMAENSAECLRQLWARNPYFDANTAYEMVDYSRRGLVTKDEFRRLMAQRSIFISDDEATSIARRFDFNGDGIVSFNEFCDEVRPKSPSKRI